MDEQQRTSLSVLASLVPAGSLLLDLGTGSGALGQYLGRHKQCQADGLTHNPEEARLAAPHYRRLEVADLDTCDLNQIFAGNRYQTIVCADVLEHLRNPGQILEQTRTLLAPDGRLLLSLPNVGYLGLIAELVLGEFRYRQEGLLDQTHLRFFTRQSLLEFLAGHGWQATRLETIPVPLAESEFGSAAGRLPPPLLRRLLSLPDAQTYQFVVEAKLLAAGTHADHRAFAMAAPGPVAAYPVALYWDDGSGYAEHRRNVAWGQLGGDLQELTFSLPEPHPLRLRLDPADRPGYLRMQRLAIVGQDGAERWQWDGRAASLLAGATQQIEAGAADSTGQGIPLLLTGDDPFFEIPISPAQLAALPPRSQLTIALSWPMSTDYLVLAEQLAVRDAAHAAALAAAQADTDRAQRQIATLDREKQDLLDQRQNLRAEQERLRQQLGQRDQELDQLAETLARSRDETASANRQRDQLHAHLRSIEESTVFRLTRPLVNAKMALDRFVGRDRQPAAATPAATDAMPADTPIEQPMPIPEHPIDIIVPVYRGLTDTRRCLESVLASPVRASFRLIAINDASPEPEVGAYLRSLNGTDPRLLILENATNLGFVATVNRGMALSTDNDVLLLNSDTEVANDWLDRLRRAAYADRCIGSVTPLSNNATICSYPRFCRDNELPEGFATAELDRLCAEVNPGRHVAVPTGVGFCMYIRRDCLAQIGLFDVERFGQGYGEENDFCMRAHDRGWRHLLTLDTFVRHAGGVSFGARKKPREIEAFEKLRRLHPRYEPLVRDHVAADPARSARLALDIARIHAARRPGLLMVTHARGGGTERHVRELAALLTPTTTAFALRPAAGGAMALEWLQPGEEEFRLQFRLPQEQPALIRVLRGLGIVHIHYHHLLGLAPEVWGLPEQLGVGYDFTAHDYYAICPQISLTGRDNRYCGEPGIAQCRQCLRQSPAPGGVDIVEWRRNYRQFLQRARHVFAPSQDAADRLRRQFPEIEIMAVEHPDLADTPQPEPEPIPLAADAPLRIAVIGALSVIKGADALEATAQEAAEHGLPVEFHLLGYGYRALATQPKAHLTIHGAYAETDLPALLAWLHPDLVWFPAQWPETYSYTLSACLQAGLPVVAPNLGAFAERLAGRGWSWVEPWDRQPGQWLEFFRNARERHFVTGTAPSPLPTRPTGNNLFCYRAHYLDGLAPPAAPAEIPHSLLEQHGREHHQGVAAAQAQAKRYAFTVLVRLRNAAWLSGLVRRIPLRWQTRIKTWLTG